jgi:carbamoyl-phosphate synthase large subunit
LALKTRGFFVLGVDVEAVPNEANEFVQVPAPRDASYPGMLRRLIREHRIGWLLPTAAEELVVVAELASELRAQGTAVFISAPASVNICHDRLATARALHAYGIPVSSRALGRDGALVRGRDVVVPDRPRDASAVTDPVWQEFPKGTEYDVLLVRHPGTPQHVIMCQVFEKTGLNDGRIGNTVEVKAVDEPDVAALAMGAARALSLTGPIDMEIHRGNDGAPRLFEINSRIGTHALKTAALFDALVELVRQGHRG